MLPIQQYQTVTHRPMLIPNTYSPPHPRQALPSYTNPSLMRSRPFSTKKAKNRCGNPVYEGPEIGERPYKHAPKFRSPLQDFYRSTHNALHTATNLHLATSPQRFIHFMPQNNSNHLSNLLCTNTL
jgi:hypothetical protein